MRTATHRPTQVAKEGIGQLPALNGRDWPIAHGKILMLLLLDLEAVGLRP